MWHSLIGSSLTLACLVFLSGPKVARWLLLLYAIIAFGISFWLTSVCFGDKGFGLVALIATIKGLIIFIPIGSATLLGILAGWGARLWVGVPAGESTLAWLQRGRGFL